MEVWSSIYYEVREEKRKCRRWVTVTDTNYQTIYTNFFSARVVKRAKVMFSQACVTHSASALWAGRDLLKYIFKHNIFEFKYIFKQTPQDGRPSRRPVPPCQGRAPPPPPAKTDPLREYGQWAGGTHPTAMHTCSEWNYNGLWILLMFMATIRKACKIMSTNGWKVQWIQGISQSLEFSLNVFTELNQW